MSWVTILTLVLQLAAYLARLSDKKETESAIQNEITILQAKRVNEAAAARDDVISGRVPPDDDDPNRRDY